MENHVNSKVSVRLSQLEKDFGQAMNMLNQRITEIEGDFNQIQGPILDEFK